MTDKAKKALEFIKGNKEARDKFSKIETLKEVFDLAKEYNLDLKEEDLNVTKEKKDILEGKKKLDVSELEKVSGAGHSTCICAIGGGGNGEKYDYVCVCVLGGYGGNDEETKCSCVIGGQGLDYVFDSQKC